MSGVSGKESSIYQLVLLLGHFRSGSFLQAAGLAAAVTRSHCSIHSAAHVPSPIYPAHLTASLCPPSATGCDEMILTVWMILSAIKDRVEMRTLTLRVILRIYRYLYWLIRTSTIYQNIYYLLLLSEVLRSGWQSPLSSLRSAAQCTIHRPVSLVLQLHSPGTSLNLCCSVQCAASYFRPASAAAWLCCSASLLLQTLLHTRVRTAAREDCVGNTRLGSASALYLGLTWPELASSPPGYHKNGVMQWNARKIEVSGAFILVWACAYTMTNKMRI